MTAERYTVVLTGLLDLKKSGEYPYLTMSRDPRGEGSHELRRGRPPYKEFGREIEFQDLPKRCRKLVKELYLDLWGLTEHASPASAQSISAARSGRMPFAR